MRAIVAAPSRRLASCGLAHGLRGLRAIVQRARAFGVLDDDGPGTARALHRSMAAVLALVMLPLIAAIGFFVGVLRADASITSAFAGAVFIALAVGVLVGALRIARDAEDPKSL